MVEDNMEMSELRKTKGFWKKPNKSWKFNEELHKSCRETSLENLT